MYQKHTPSRVFNEAPMAKTTDIQASALTPEQNDSPATTPHDDETCYAHRILKPKVPHAQLPPQFTQGGLNSSFDQHGDLTGSPTTFEAVTWSFGSKPSNTLSPSLIVHIEPAVTSSAAEHQGSAQEVQTVVNLFEDDGKVIVKLPHLLQTDHQAGSPKNNLPEGKSDGEHAKVSRVGQIHRISEVKPSDHPSGSQPAFIKVRSLEERLMFAKPHWWPMEGVEIDKCSVEHIEIAPSTETVPEIAAVETHVHLISDIKASDHPSGRQPAFIKVRSLADRLIFSKPHWWLPKAAVKEGVVGGAELETVRSGG